MCGFKLSLGIAVELWKVPGGIENDEVWCVQMLSQPIRLDDPIRGAKGHVRFSGLFTLKSLGPAGFNRLNRKASALC